jgi:hypothetical protein
MLDPVQSRFGCSDRQLGPLLDVTPDCGASLPARWCPGPPADPFASTVPAASRGIVRTRARRGRCGPAGRRVLRGIPRTPRIGHTTAASIKSRACGAAGHVVSDSGTVQFRLTGASWRMALPR